MGEIVTVTEIQGENCLVASEQGWGYARVSCIELLGPQENGDQAEGVMPAQAAASAQDALKKKYRSFDKSRYYWLCETINERNGFQGPLYYCGYYDERDQYAYGALVDADSGQVMFCTSYLTFAAPEQKELELLPEGEITVSLSSDTLAIGETVDITVQAWTLFQCRYTLYRNGEPVADTAGQHFSAAFRAKEAGNYTLQVTVTDEKKKSVSAECAFAVDGTLPPQDGPVRIYSQKDGWWADKTYRHSNLQKSGCAIFALAHALNRMGMTDGNTLPAELAAVYARCLVPEEGTNNTLLINSAARDFGFKTRGTLYEDAAQIVRLLQQGVLFSFSPARGHIAMIDGISPDGAMGHVVDSCPEATFTRIVGESLYYPKGTYSYRPAQSLGDLPGIRWFLDTGEYGGAEYWMPIQYLVKRGVRLIQPLN